MKQVMNYNKDNGLLNMMKNRPHDPANTNFEVPLGAVADVENGMICKSNDFLTM